MAYTFLDLGAGFQEPRQEFQRRAVEWRLDNIDDESSDGQDTILKIVFLFWK